MMVAALAVVAALGTPQQAAKVVVPVTLDGPVAGSLGPGDPRGETGAYFDCFSFRGSERQVLTVRLRSAAFEPMLVLRRGATCDGNLLYVARGDGDEALVRTDLGYTETYSLTVRSTEAGVTGAYDLTFGDAAPRAQQPPSVQQVSFKPDRVSEGCGYRPGSGRLVPVTYGVFSDEPVPPFADRWGAAYRTAEGWGPLSETPFTAADGRAWFVNNETLTIDGVVYRKHGLPRVYGLQELAYRGEHDSVGVFEFAETGPDPHAGHAHAAGAVDAAELIQVLVRPAGCEFQPYRPA